MIYIINKNLLIEEAIQRHSNIEDKNSTSEDHIKDTEKLYDLLEQFVKKHNIPKEDIIIFGSVILGLKGLRSPNDLDIGIRQKSIPILKKNYSAAKGSYGAQYDIGKLSFIHELAVPKYNNQSLFNQKMIKHRGFNTITFEQWKNMQKKDPLQKDKNFLSIK